MSNETTPQDLVAMSPASTGSVQPLAWSVVRLSDEFVASVALFEDAAKREAGRRGHDWAVVPLYRSPTLTDAEREAIYTAAMACEDLGYKALPMSLRDIVQRLK